MRCFPQTSARYPVQCRNGVVATSNGAESNSFDSIWAPISTPHQRTANFVKTQSGIPTFNLPIPSNPCNTCSGTGKTTCGACRGKGRVNYRSAAMLPSGAWPEWCTNCRASGRWICCACLGTGEKREPIGFRIE